MCDFFHLAPRIHYGRGAAAQTGPALRDLGVRQVLLVSDPGVIRAGVADPVIESIKAAGIGISEFTEIRTNPDERQVAAAVAQYRESGCDGVLGIGGGSAMDVAKSAVAVLAGGGTIEDYEDGARTVTGPYPPLVQVPTTSGTGSEVVAGAIITDSKRIFKMHIVAVPAQVAVCDPELTRTLPAVPTAASGIDALAHAIGAYVSRERQPLADANALYGIRQINRALPAAVADGTDIAAREQMMLGALTAGISMKGGGAVDHAFAHAVNALFDVHHGAGVAMFLADGMEFNLPHLPERFADIAEALDAGRDGQGGIQVVRDLVASLPLPTLADVGVTVADVPALTAKVLEDGFHLGLNPVDISESEISRILTTAAKRGATR
ncbi:iron-containing alcohol dehydrogenase [Streptomyces sp. NBC_01262]|uniref:iron-containing alcohol dehydrogenase n=1 Tax=Streptomyces sp. NBC_01262 TaxID=2903803 RepID=UPI002E334237|nr:iron-containing alcohol dehydrogenase [Streptomyces sp. NBC_01262]